MKGISTCLLPSLCALCEFLAKCKTEACVEQLFRKYITLIKVCEPNIYVIICYIVFQCPFFAVFYYKASFEIYLKKCRKMANLYAPRASYVVFMHVVMHINIWETLLLRRKIQLYIPEAVIQLRNF